VSTDGTTGEGTGEATGKSEELRQAAALEELDAFEESETGWWSALTHPTRRGWTLIISGGVTAGLIAVAFLMPVPFVKLAPGPTFNVIGQKDGTDVISITGTETFPVSGTLDMTTVLESGGPRGGLTFVDAIASWLDPADAVVPRELIFPDDVTGEQVRERQAMLFSTSESNAVAAAMTYLDRPLITQNVVTAVYEGTPADGVLLPKDEIVSINGVEVKKVPEVVDAVRSEPIGTTFEFVVRRDGVEVDGAMQDDVETTVSVTSAENPDDAGVPYIGIGVGAYYSAEFPIDFTLEDVGGPSAGLMFATGIVDKLTPDDLVAGEHIAGTGTIEPDGTVGPIGGIRQKLAGARNAGATLFLMPADHCTEAAGHIPDGLTVTPVTTLSEGIDAIRAYTAGEQVPSCPADAA
jgi:PDZ domain-containing protein